MSAFRDTDVLRWGYIGIAILYLVWVFYRCGARGMTDTSDTRTFREWLPKATKYHHELGMRIILVLGGLAVVLALVWGKVQ